MRALIVRLKAEAPYISVRLKADPTDVPVRLKADPTANPQCPAFVVLAGSAAASTLRIWNGVLFTTPMISDWNL